MYIYIYIYTHYILCKRRSSARGPSSGPTSGAGAATSGGRPRGRTREFSRARSSIFSGAIILGVFRSCRDSRRFGAAWPKHQSLRAPCSVVCGLGSTPLRKKNGRGALSVNCKRSCAELGNVACQHFDMSRPDYSGSFAENCEDLRRLSLSIVK